MFNLKQFIDGFVIIRPTSMFSRDVASHKSDLISKIEGKTVCVIGGAG